MKRILISLLLLFVFAFCFGYTAFAQKGDKETEATLYLFEIPVTEFQKNGEYLGVDPRSVLTVATPNIDGVGSVTPTTQLKYFVGYCVATDHGIMTLTSFTNGIPNAKPYGKKKALSIIGPSPSSITSFALGDVIENGEANVVMRLSADKARKEKMTIIKAEDVTWVAARSPGAKDGQYETLSSPVFQGGKLVGITKGIFYIRDGYMLIELITP